MAKTKWNAPLKTPVQLRGHADEDDAINECETLDTSSAWVVVAGIPKEANNNDDYNCLGWVAFNGPKNGKAEPDFIDTGHLRGVTEELEATGWKKCNKAEATCVVVGAHEGNVAHVFMKWKGMAKVDNGWRMNNGDTEWWESKMGQGGPHILHKRDAMSKDKNYGKELAWFKA